MSIETKIHGWEELQRQLKEIKEEELALRNEICLELASDMPSGTHTFNYGQMRVKVTNKLNVSLDQKIYKDIQYQLSDDEQGCIRTKYELDMRQYKAIAESPILDEAVVVKDATPTLSVDYVE